MKRESVPKPPQKLLDQVKAKRVIPLIGAGLSRSVQSVGESKHSMPNYIKLLEMLFEKVEINEFKNKKLAKVLIENAKKDATQIDMTVQFIRKEIGEMTFYKEIREILEPIDAEFKPSLGHKLLRILNFQRILTTNYDRLLEKFVGTHHEMFTASDLQAFRLFSIAHDRYFILKLHGDITRPNTIPFDLYSHYGLDAHGNSSDRKTLEAEQLQDFLKQIFKENTVLFLGSSLSETEGYLRILSNLVISWGGLPHRHYALVPASNKSDIKAIKMNLHRQANVEFIEYIPDSVHSQVWEFLAFLIAGTQPEPPEPCKEWGKSYLPDRRADYLKFQLERERTAKSVYYFTPSLTNVITTDQDIKVSIRDDLKDKGIYSKEQLDEIINIMLARRHNLENRLKSNNIEVRVLFLESELRDYVNTSKNNHVKSERYRCLLELMSEPGLHVRLIPEISGDHLRDKYEVSYGLIFNQTKPKQLESDVTIAYASQANKNYFDIHLIQINTYEVKERVYQFERFWGSGRNKRETKEIIEKIINI